MASILRACIYLPQVLPIIVAAIVWSWILDPQNGALNALLRDAGLGFLRHDLLGDPKTALLTVMAVLVWFQLGYPVVIFMAALQRADPELIEAAEIDGASWWQRLWRVIVPQIRPEIYVVLLTCTVASLRAFAWIYALTTPENACAAAPAPRPGRLADAGRDDHLRAGDPDPVRARADERLQATRAVRVARAAQLP